MQESNTIAAISTPLGTGGLAVIRISGPEALIVGERVFRPAGRKTLSQMMGYTAAYGEIGREEILDTGIALVCRRPKSYTGEDVVEISCHGGAFLARRILRLILDQGARMAQPGEFTKRAFLNGKLSLPQAEAVMDAISAQSDQAVRMAAAASEGKLYKQIQEMTESLLEISAYMAAWFDFPEEDIEQLSTENIRRSLTKAREGIEKLLAGYDQGRLIREGITAAIVGKPNVGKSTLMNLLAREERSIVTDLPGTTRDVVEEAVRLGPYLLHLADTAGIRETEDQVESIGVNLAEKRIESAQLILAVFDASEPLSAEDHRLLQKLEGRRCIAIVNKTDLDQRLEVDILESRLKNVVALSAREGDGVEKLIDTVEKLLALESFDAGEAVLANERQLDCARLGEKYLAEAEDALNLGETLDAVSVLLESAITSLLQLTGERATDKTVEMVFERFCVGK